MNTSNHIHLASSLVGREGEESGSVSKIETYSFTVEPFHVDFTGHLFLGILGNHLLNAAGRHSHNRGWGIDQLNEAHYTWVLSRLSIELAETPSQYEHVIIETWVESVMKLFTERNFLIRNADDGRIYGYARSIWAMIDMQTRQPSNLLELKGGDILNYVMSVAEKPCPIEKFNVRVRLTDDATTSTVFTHYSDVDINGHINSVKYIEHILDLFPREQFERHRIHRFDIAYKTESYLGDTLTLQREEASEGTHIIEVRKHVGSKEKPAGEVVVQAKIIWQ
ncbi:MAG: acyl-[acyl-carrier-protein] thioesterase [Bacteroidaceae bacterium]|nr:acyl-[acyl-carrier-protein] thioesterase [Bacteroidales bacterium]MBP5769906.1 acyl-[acyl-carrier-protein] thioesterase [Bacteroidaceae bacterium]